MRKLATLKGIAVFTILLASTAWGQLSGTYYIGTTGTKPGGGDPDYLTLKSAIVALNTQGINGDVTMYFTSDLTEPSTCQLGVNTSSFSITFKPYLTVTSVTLIFNKNVNLTGNALFGLWVIGSKDTTGAGSLTTTNNVMIDGSKTVGGTTRDLTIMTTGTSASGSYPFRIAGACDNITIKNCNISCAYTGGSSTYGIRISAKFTAAAADSFPTNITIRNNYVVNVGGAAGHGILIDGSASQTTFSSGVVIRDNLIVARTRGVMLNNSGSTDIFKNTIRVKQTSGGLLSYAVFGLAVGGGLSSIINVYNNTIDSLQTAQTTTVGVFGIIGIYCASNATWNVYNNMISNFYTTATADPNLQNIFGIYASAGTANIYHNTISMNQLAYTLGATGRQQSYAGIYVTGTATATAKNNIIVSSQTGDSSYALYVSSGTLTSDYNDLYQANAAGYIGFISATAQQSLANWQSASSQDANAKNVAVTFASGSDLHLAGGSNGDFNLTGVTGLGIATDIDGDSRSGTAPYMGADEASSPLPVELSSFAVTARGNSVELAWKTATETNNYGFQIERKVVNAEWAKVGFVEGHGTTNSPRSYSFRENVASAGKYIYRLKQIDRDGKFTYSKEVEAVIGLAPNDYSLGQNYPNPFNPSSTIRFALKTAGHATLKVYNSAGQEVKTLFDDMAEADKSYSVLFDGTGLASGTYFYILQTPASREVKKMLMLK